MSQVETPHGLPFAALRGGANGDHWSPLRGGGACGQLMRSIDWSRTPIGPVEQWPVSLRTTVSTLLHSRHPMFLWWGPELIQFYNDAYLPSFGIGKHPTAMGQRGAECWPEIWPIIHPQIVDVMERGIPSWHENQLVPIFRNGRIEDVYWTYSYSPVFGEDGRIAGTLVVCTETTHAVLSREELERARREAELARNRLNALFENAPAFVATMSGPEHVFEMVNAPYQRLVGQDRELLRLRLKDALPEVAEQGFVKLLDQVYQRAEPFIGHETHVRLDRDGTGKLEDAFLTFIYQPRLDSEGRASGIDVFGFDVTDQVLARKEALDTAEANRILAQLIPQQVWRATADGALDYVNERVLTYFGSTEAEILGAGWQSVIHPDDLPISVERWAHALATGEEYEVEFRLRRADGAYRWHLGRALSLRDAEGRIVKWFGTNTDIDDTKRIREELKTRNDFEQHLLGIASHDLRNPLSAIALTATALTRREDFDERGTRSVLRIQAAAERALRMVKDLLDFTQARLGSGIPVSPREMDLKALVQQVILEVEASFPECRLRMEHVGDGMGNWDADRLAQVVTNLLSNAVKYGAPGAEITVCILGAGDSVSLEVHNRGPPIPVDEKPRLFQPMQRMAAGPDSSGRSVGLGLYIVKSIVEAHGGEVDVRSSEEEGTTFIVTLPRRIPGPGASSPRSPSVRAE